VASTVMTSVCGRRMRLHRSGPPCHPFPHWSNPSTACAACPPMSGGGGGIDGDDFGVWATNAPPPLGPPMPSVSPLVQPLDCAHRLSTYEWQQWRRQQLRCVGDEHASTTRAPHAVRSPTGPTPRPRATCPPMSGSGGGGDGDNFGAWATTNPNP
jgi:hypothetical protein